MVDEKPDDLLAKARKAWADKNWAIGQINRLGRYKRMSLDMREDYSRATKKLDEANSALQKILGVAP